jgi:hypothetical protein
MPGSDRLHALQLMDNVNASECVRSPEVAVTETEEVVVPPPPLGIGLLLLQPVIQFIVKMHTIVNVSPCRNLRLRRRPAMHRTVAASDAPGQKGFRSGVIRAEVAAVAMDSVVMAAADAGVTLAGEKVQLAPPGRPEHAKETAEPNPFSGAIVTVVVPLLPAVTLSKAKDRERLKSPGGRLMVYVAVARVLLVYPLANAMALMVSVLFTEISAVYKVQEVVGMEPLVAQ